MKPGPLRRLRAHLEAMEAEVAAAHEAELARQEALDPWGSDAPWGGRTVVSPLRMESTP